MSLKEDLENNVTKVAVLLRRLMPETMDQFLPDSRPNLPSASLLSGSYLHRAWDRYYSGKVGKERYGLYFIFYRSNGRLIPFYVGKGRLPSRWMSHFSHTQYIDMLISGYFGGVPRNPKFIEHDPERHEKVVTALNDLEVGFLLCDSKSAVELEKAFIYALRPLANREIYANIPQHALPYDLRQLIERWPANESQKEGEQHSLPDLNEVEKIHKEHLNK